MTIRVRLTLLFVALVAAVGMLRSVAVLSGYSSVLWHLAITDTQNKAAEVEDYLLDLDTELATVGDAGGLRLDSPESLPRAFSDDGSYLQLLAPDGRVLNRSPNLGDQHLPIRTRAGVERVELPLPHLVYSTRTLLVTRPLDIPGQGRLGWVQAATPLQSQERMLQNLALLEIGGWVGSLLLALVAGLLFAGRALSPVAAIAREVRGWGPEDLHRRLPLGETPADELGALALTFNALFDRLEASFQAQRRFVADASHELKSPLTAIRGHLQLIARRGAAHPDELGRWSGTALSEVDRLTRLVDDLLGLASGEEPSGLATRAPVDLATLTREVVARYAPITPRIRAIAASPVWVSGDADRLRQVLINLVDNAERASREGGEIEVEARREGDRALWRVRDTGVGIPAEATGRLFDRFYRVDSARDREQGGTGLGLSIVASIVAAHGGEITVESTVGVGTAFTVSFPLAELRASPMA